MLGLIEVSFLITNFESPKTTRLEILSLLATASPKMRVSYYATLLVTSNSSLKDRVMAYFEGQINTTLNPDPSLIIPIKI